MADSIFEAVFNNARKDPDKLCIADEECALTYGEYISLVSRFSSVLAARGIKKGDRVVAEAVQSVKFLALQLGLQAIGGVFVPLERGCAKAKIESVAKTAGARLIVTPADIKRAVTLDSLFE